MLRRLRESDAPVPSISKRRRLSPSAAHTASEKGARVLGLGAGLGFMV